MIVHVTSTFLSAWCGLTDHLVNPFLETFIVDVVLAPLRSKMRRKSLRESHLHRGRGESKTERRAGAGKIANE